MIAAGVLPHFHGGSVFFEKPRAFSRLGLKNCAQGPNGSGH